MNLFGDDLIIGEIRFQSDRLQSILTHMESDGAREDNVAYYASSLENIERVLRKIRTRSFDHADHLLVTV